MLQIAIPNKGSLSEDAALLLRDAGYRCRRQGRELIIYDMKNDVNFVFLRPRDIATYVSHGVLDLGITGRDLAIDSRIQTAEVMSLGFGKSAFYYAVPADSALTPDDFSHIRVATSYPNLVRADLKRRNIPAEIVRLDGAIEISIQLGVAEAIADVVQTGGTLKEAGLKIVGDPILESEAILIARTEDICEKKGVQLFMDRVRGIVVARDYVMVEYDVPERNLEKACQITPGIESPTISPLSKKGWVAVKSMTRIENVNRIMDRLTDIDAKGIIVTDIRTCRI